MKVRTCDLARLSNICAETDVLAADAAQGPMRLAVLPCCKAPLTERTRLVVPYQTLLQCPRYIAHVTISPLHGGRLTMQRLSAWARWIVLGILGSQFALEIFKQVAERIGLYDRPREAVGTILNFFLSLAEISWLRTTMLAFGCFAAGMWLDWLLRKLDRSRAKARENLGYEMTNLANDIDNALALVDRSPRTTKCMPCLTKASCSEPALRRKSCLTKAALRLPSVSRRRAGSSLAFGSIK